MVLGSSSPVSPASPGLVINADPITISAGKTVSVDLPAIAAQLGFVLVYNASPYTLQVSQGLVLGQVPAFTGQVYALTTPGQPLSLTAVQGGGIIVPGTDSTIYLTWSQYTPYGSWPAAIGAGAVPFASDLLFASPGAGLPAGNPGVPSAKFSTLGFGGVVVTTLPGNTGVTYRVRLRWFDPTGTVALAERQFVTGAVPLGGAVACAGFPNFGDLMDVTIVTNAPELVPILVEGRQAPLSFWTTPPQANQDAIGTWNPVLLSYNQPVLAGVSAFFFSAWPYEGPVSVGLGASFAPATAGDWTARLNVDTEDASDTVTLHTWTAGTELERYTNDLIVVPPGVLSLEITNNTASTHTFAGTLVADYSRMAT